MKTITGRTALPADVITRQAGTNFYYSFLSLPQERREAIETVYAYCRLMDDIVDDDGIENPRYELQKWRKEVAECYEGTPQTQLGKQLQQVVTRFPIRRQHLEAMITGMELDLDTHRYQTFEELERYCYHVASVTGLMCIEIFGYTHDSAHDYAINLGKALQIVNILRDVREDAARNRIYLPAEDLERFGYSEQELLNSVYNDRFVELMKFEANRARAYFEAAHTALHAEDRPQMVAAEIMGKIYFTILERIERADYNVYAEKFRLNRLEKAFVALKVWAASRFKLNWI